MSRRSVLVVIVLWVLTVACVSALTWTVISIAGERVGQPAVVAVPTPLSTTTPGHNPGTWIGAVGKVTARCSDERITLVAATPLDGFAVEVKDRGPEQLQLEFEREGSTKESRIRAVCVDGSPVFTKL
ncbi:MAG: hypothetical protein ACOH1Y_10565 [Propionicimonas sp.]